MMATEARRQATRTLDGWARSVLIEVGAIHECEDHGWAKHRADSHAQQTALMIARNDPPPGVAAHAATAAMIALLDSMGDTCPECPAA